MWRQFASLVVLLVCRTEADSVASDKLICGPIAVQKVLECYGKSEPLAKIVADVFASSQENYATMQDLVRCLDCRGIYCSAAVVDAPQDIVWPYPVVVHISPVGSDRIGHFGVLLPDRTRPDKMELFLGPGTRREYPNKNSPEAISTCMVFTSAEPVSISAIGQARSSQTALSNLRAVAYSGFAFLVIYCLFSRKTKKRSSVCVT